MGLATWPLKNFATPTCRRYDQPVFARGRLAMPDHDPRRTWSTEERELGLDRRITRRDFLNATLLGAGGALLGAHSPAEAALARSLASSAELGVHGTGEALAWEGPGGVGDYARSHGNMFDVVQTAHAMRDGKFAGTLANVHDTG